MAGIFGTTGELERFRENIARWRKLTLDLHRFADELPRDVPVAPSKLVYLESTASEIYTEIEAFTAASERYKTGNPGADDATEIGDALRLLLLELTELGTKMYSSHSAAFLDQMDAGRG